MAIIIHFFFCLSKVIVNVTEIKFSWYHRAREKNHFWVLRKQSFFLCLSIYNYMCLYASILNYTCNSAGNAKSSNFQEELAVMWDSEILEKYNQQSWLAGVGIFLYLFLLIQENIKMKLYSPRTIQGTDCRFEIKTSFTSVWSGWQDQWKNGYCDIDRKQYSTCLYVGHS